MLAEFVENCRKKRIMNLRKADVFILVCTSNSIQSDAVRTEWKAALMAKKPIVPLFDDSEHIPFLLRPKLGLQYRPGIDQFDQLIEGLHSLVKKKIGSSE